MSPKRYAVAGAVGLGLFTGGLLTGRFSRPAEVREEHKTTVEQKAETKVAVAQDRKVQVHKVTVTERKPDGTTKTTTTEDERSDTDRKTASDTTLDSKATQVDSRVVRAQSSYRLRLDVGWDPRVWTAPTPRSLALGAETRVLGPLWAGLWVRQDLGGRPVTAFGLSLAFEF